MLIINVLRMRCKNGIVIKIVGKIIFVFVIFMVIKVWLLNIINGILKRKNIY